jgi:hypothetical protein
VLGYIHAMRKSSQPTTPHTPKLQSTFYPPIGIVSYSCVVVAENFRRQGYDHFALGRCTSNVHELSGRAERERAGVHKFQGFPRLSVDGTHGRD